jgi:hypothetical protein
MDQSESPGIVEVNRALGVNRFVASQLGQALDGISSFFFGAAKLVQVLQVQPELRARSEEMREPQRGISSDGAGSIQNLSDTIRRHMDFAREFCRAHTECLELFGEMFSRMNGNDSHEFPFYEAEPHVKRNVLR